MAKDLTIQEITARMPGWVKNRYLRWWKRFNASYKKIGIPEVSFECYMGGVLKNALEKMNDL